MAARALTSPRAPEALRRRAWLVIRACLQISLLATLAALAGAPPATAQTSARVPCRNTPLPSSVSDAKAALEGDPDELRPRLRLADALVDQGCYEDAVAVLEAGRARYPHNAELSGKLRDVRSMIVEQTYIQGITEAADAAKLQHSYLRCLKFADLESCNEALKATPDDLSLLVAKADLLVQGGHPAEAIGIYARAAQLSPANESIKSKLAAARALGDVSAAPAAGTAAGVSTTASAAQKPRRSKASSRPALAANQGGGAPAAGVAAQALTAPIVVPAKTYSNDAPPGRSN